MKREASYEKECKLSPDEQHDLSKEFLEAIYELPDGERIKTCIQCGTCSSSCPNASNMDFSPREIIAALRAGLLSRVLRSNTVWLCTSCYFCTVRCPQKIRFTDVMYELKRLGIQHGIYPKNAGGPIMSNVFVELVDNYGRNPETLLMMKYYMKMGVKGVMQALGNIGMAGKLVMRKRMNINPTPKRIKGMEQIKKILDHALAREAQGGS
ncbi:4Fe-4S dicluster domain-containing protein [bacterium]|nr:4Fe-4S dicluster domain-containing protein [bacterium]